jgi:GTPase SAR1 family protein
LKAIGGGASVRRVINTSGRTTASTGSSPSSLISWRGWVGGSMARRGRLIVFLGPVGVGKSTIIRGLTQELRAHGFRTYTTFIKAFHGPAYALWVLTARLLGLNGKYAPWFIIPRSGRVNLARTLMMLSIYLDAFLSIPFKLVIIKILKYFKYYILSEEYIQSTLFDYIFATIDLKIKGKFINIPINIMYILLIKYLPDVIVVLMADIYELRRRWKIRGYGDPQLRYIKLQYIFLNEIHKLNRTLNINTSNISVKAILNKVLNEIFKNDEI